MSGWRKKKQWTFSANIQTHKGFLDMDTVTFRPGDIVKPVKNVFDPCSPIELWFGDDYHIVNDDLRVKDNQGYLWPVDTGLFELVGENAGQSHDDDFVSDYDEDDVPDLESITVATREGKFFHIDISADLENMDDAAFNARLLKSLQNDKFVQIGDMIFPVDEILYINWLPV
jgi:hypothetical protein